jgi:hypothetical protein
MDEVVVAGRRYISFKAAARTFHYCAPHIRSLVRTGHVRQSRRGRRVFVCYNDLLAYQQAQRARRTKWALMRAWWDSHPAQRRAIKSGGDLARRLAAANPPVIVTGAYASMFLRRHCPAGQRTSLTEQVIAWLLADPARLALTVGEVRRALLSEKKLDVSLPIIDYARRRCDKLHPAAFGGVIDLTLYATTRDAAKILGETRLWVNRRVREGVLVGRKWRNRVLVSRASIDEYLSGTKGRGDGSVG